MAALSYAVRFSRRGPGGVQQMVVSVVNVNSGDTVDLAPDLTKVTAAAMVGVTSSVPAVYTGVGMAGSVITLTAGGPNQPAALVKDDVDLVVLGPAIAT